MSKLYQLIQSEYKFEYITEYVKPEGLMDKKTFLPHKFILKLFLKNI